MYVALFYWNNVKMIELIAIENLHHRISSKNTFISGHVSSAIPHSPFPTSDVINTNCTHVVPPLHSTFSSSCISHVTLLFKEEVSCSTHQLSLAVPDVITTNCAHVLLPLSLVFMSSHVCSWTRVKVLHSALHCSHGDLSCAVERRSFVSDISIVRPEQLVLTLIVHTLDQMSRMSSMFFIF